MRIPDLFSTEDAALELGLKPQTMRVMRMRGDGPTYYKIGGRCYYSPEDLVSWLRSCKREPDHLNKERGRPIRSSVTTDYSGHKKETTGEVCSCGYRYYKNPGFAHNCEAVKRERNI